MYIYIRVHVVQATRWTLVAQERFAWAPLQLPRMGHLAVDRPETNRYIIGAESSMGNFASKTIANAKIRGFFFLFVTGTCIRYCRNCEQVTLGF